MAWVALAAAAVSALGAMKQGQDEKAAANYNAAQAKADADANTAAAKVQAQRIRQQGAQQASHLVLKLTRVLRCASHLVLRVMLNRMLTQPFLMVSTALTGCVRRRRRT